MLSAVTFLFVVACGGIMGFYIGWLIDMWRADPPHPAPRARRVDLLAPGTVIPGVRLTDKARVSGPLESDDPDTTGQIIIPKPVPELLPARGPLRPAPDLRWDGTWGLPEVPLWDPDQTAPVPVVHTEHL